MVSGGYFLDSNPQEFDHQLIFENSPIEAACMDPQQTQTPRGRL